MKFHTLSLYQLPSNTRSLLSSSVNIYLPLRLSLSLQGETDVHTVFSNTSKPYLPFRLDAMCVNCLSSPLINRFTNETTKNTTKRGFSRQRFCNYKTRPTENEIKIVLESKSNYGQRVCTSGYSGHENTAVSHTVSKRFTA